MIECSAAGVSESDTTPGSSVTGRGGSSSSIAGEASLVCLLLPLVSQFAGVEDTRDVSQTWAAY